MADNNDTGNFCQQDLEMRESFLREKLTLLYATLFIAAPLCLEFAQDVINQYSPEHANNFLLQNVGNAAEGWFPAAFAYITMEMFFRAKRNSEILPQR